VQQYLQIYAGHVLATLETLFTLSPFHLSLSHTHTHTHSLYFSLTCYLIRFYQTGKAKLAPKRPKIVPKTLKLKTTTFYFYEEIITILLLDNLRSLLQNTFKVHDSKFCISWWLFTFFLIVSCNSIETFPIKMRTNKFRLKKLQKNCFDLLKVCFRPL
jgi:hypothetical protein